MSITRIAAALLGLCILSACQSAKPVDYKPLSFTRYQPIYMAVSDIKLIEEYKSPMKPPNVEHLIPYSPAEAMEVWVKDRLRTVGGNKRVEIIIRDGSVVANELAKQEGFKGFLTVDQDKRYDARIEIEMRVYGDTSAISEASINVNSLRSVTMAENASVSTRNVVFRKMIADLMEGLNAELEKNMYQYLGTYISYSNNP